MSTGNSKRVDSTGRSHGGHRNRLEGFPVPWRRIDIEQTGCWVRETSQQECDGLLAGLERFERSGKRLPVSTGADFPFAHIEQLKSDIEDALYRRQGFLVLRGIPIEGLAVERIESLYWGLCNHLGVLRPQGRDSGLLKSVRDSGGEYRSASGRGYHTNAELDFHTDFSDLVGLLCINAAQSGGVSRVANSQAVHDAMRERAPELVQVLYEPVYYSRQGEESPTELPYYKAPIFSQQDGWFSCRYTRNHIRYAHRFEGVPDPTEEQLAAMDLLDRTVAESEFILEMTLQPGDLQILNNHTILHSRTGFTDHEQPERKRHLLRSWISNPRSQPLSPLLQDAYHEVRPGVVRGGIIGQAFDEEKRTYTRNAAAYHGMRL